MRVNFSVVNSVLMIMCLNLSVAAAIRTFDVRYDFCFVLLAF